MFKKVNEGLKVKEKLTIKTKKDKECFIYERYSFNLSNPI